MSSPIWKTICDAESEKNLQKLEEIFQSITSTELNESVSDKDSTTLLISLLLLFDKDDKYPYLVKNLFNSPNFDCSKLDINRSTERKGYTALMSAAYRGHIEIVQKLLVMGADPKARTSDNVTSLFLACKFGHIETFKCLLPLVDHEEFDLKRKFNGKTMKEEAKNLEHKSSNYTEMVKLIDEVPR